MKHLFCFGLGYSAAALARRLTTEGWTVSGTSSTPAGVAALERDGFSAHLFDGSQPSFAVRSELARASHVLVSVPPHAAGDPVLRHHARDIGESKSIEWIGYLSTIGVYGDHRGAWVDESTPPHPKSERSRFRVAAENDWLELARCSGKRTQIFRLAGIYGPGRSPIDNVREGTARRIVKPGQVFNRIHVEDIAAILSAAMAGRGTETIYNVTDDEPAAPQDVVAFAAALLGVAPPPEMSFAEAGLSPMAASFYAENKRVRNERVKRDLGIALIYPTFREGLRALSAGA